MSRVLCLMECSFYLLFPITGLTLRKKNEPGWKIIRKLFGGIRQFGCQIMSDWREILIRDIWKVWSIVWNSIVSRRLGEVILSFAASVCFRPKRLFMPSHVSVKWFRTNVRLTRNIYSWFLEVWWIVFNSIVSRHLGEVILLRTFCFRPKRSFMPSHVSVKMISHKRRPIDEKYLFMIFGKSDGLHEIRSFPGI